MAKRKTVRANRAKRGPRADSDKSKYGRKKAWRDSNCKAPLPFFPDVMILASDRKPWK